MHNNNCDGMRLIAALAVVVSHCFMLTAGHNAWEPVFRLSHGQTTGGGLAVFTFFALSGYLIAQSFDRTANLGLFALARAARILPGLLAVLVVTGFVAGPVLSTLPVADYLLNPGPYRYVVWNASLLHYTDRLPGVFPANPMPGTMNGSLWTLHIEAACYVAIAALGTVGLLNRWSTAGLSLAAIALTAWLDAINYPVLLAAHFMAGAAFHYWRPACSRVVLACCVAALLAAMRGRGFPLVSATAGTYLVCTLAFGGFGFGWAGQGLSRFAGRTDLSYGLYIWSFPLQQMIVERAGPGLRWWSCAALAIPLALIMAALSWYLIEQPSLRWRRRLALRRARRLTEAGMRASAAAGHPASSP